MAKTIRPRKTKINKRASNANGDDSVVTAYHDPRNIGKFARQAEPIEAKTEAQGHYMLAIKSKDLVFAIGPAGTGKTFIAATAAADQLMARQIERIIVTRPNIEVGVGMGFLPGELEDKYRPFLAPFEAIMVERMGRGVYDCAVKAQKISPQPLAYMRGATFNDAFVILDEAQNCTPAEMKMFLTRIGRNCTVVIDGDPDQCDLNGPSGLVDALNRVTQIRGVEVVEFTEDDIVRSGIVREILKAYRN